MHPAVFLDLDNTIIRDNGGSADPDGVVLLQGVAPAIASLRGLGYKVVVAANHEGVARGRMNEDDVQTLHARVAELVKSTANGAVIDAFYYCPFHPKGNLDKYKKDHRNRKPKPGMLIQAAEEMGLDLKASWMIGDELADIQAGHAAGARTVLLRADADRLQPVDLTKLEGVTNDAPEQDRPSGPDFFAVGLVDAARLIAQQPRVELHEHKRAEPGRKWDAEKIAKLQVPRPKPAATAKGEPAAMGRAFRPWGAPVSEEDDKPMVAKPFRKRASQEAPAAEEAAPRQSAQAAQPPAPPAPAQTPPPASRDEIPDNIREAIQNKKQARDSGIDNEPGVQKTLRLILHELRAQRGNTQDFSFLTIIAVALQLIAVVCVLGGLFMGGGSDGVFIRWLGVGITAQLLSISTMLYGR